MGMVLRLKAKNMMMILLLVTVHILPLLPKIRNVAER